MKTSLREKLNTLIAQRGVVTWLEIKDLVESGKLGRKFKLSNAERRLRASESPMVEAIMEHGHISAYKWLGVKPQMQTYRVEGMNKFIQLKI